eukprot:gene4916-gene5410
MIPNVDGFVGFQHRQRHLQMRLATAIGIVFGVLVQTFGNHKLLQGQLALPKTLRQRRQMFMNRRDNLFTGFAFHQNLIDDVFTSLFRQDTPITTHQIETFHLLLIRYASIGMFFDDQRGVFLLLQQQHRTEDPIQIQFQRLVQLVHFPLHLQPQFFHLGQIVRIDHDGIGITVNHIQLQLIRRQIHRPLEGFTSLGRHQRRNGSGIETGKGETETTVHRVGRQLQRLLTNVQLLPLDGVTFVLQQVLHLSTTIDEGFDH